MSRDRRPEIQTFALIGVCLLHVQLAERVLAGGVELVLQDPTLTAAKLLEQTEPERKRTLGDFLRGLKSRAKIEAKFKDKLYRFLRMRNTFVHNLSEVPGWNLRTKEGRKVATEFLIELTMLAFGVTGVFMSLFAVSTKEDFGKDLLREGSVEEKRLISILETHFGPTARKILAGRYRKPALVYSKESAKG